MTGTEGEKWKEMPKRCRHSAMRRDNPYVGVRKKKNSKQAASWETASWKLKKLDKK